MNRFMRRPTRSFVSLAAVLAIVVAFATAALAGHLGEDVKSYTGCLATNGGTLTLIKEGNSPQKPCPSGSVLAHFSGGDITKISVGNGLKITNGDASNSDSNGDVTIELDSAFSLPQGCTTGKVAEWNGTGWVCGTDDNTTYSAGTGLSLIGTTFSITPDYRVKNTPDCSSGQFATGFDSDGLLQCGAPPSSTTSALVAREHNPANGKEEIGILSNGEDFELVGLNVPAGSYVLFASGWIRFFDGGASSTHALADCRLFQDGNVIQQQYAEDDDVSDIWRIPMAFSTGASFASAGRVSVKCSTIKDGMYGMNFRLVAIPVDSVTGQ